MAPSDSDREITPRRHHHPNHPHHPHHHPAQSGKLDNLMAPSTIDSESDGSRHPSPSLSSSPREREDGGRGMGGGKLRSQTLTSLCIISHHPFFSTFRECLFVLKKLIDACNESSSPRRVGASVKRGNRDNIWTVLTSHSTEMTPSIVLHDVREIETWILRLLSTPVPVPGSTRIEVNANLLSTTLHYIHFTFLFLFLFLLGGSTLAHRS